MKLLNLSEVGKILSMSERTLYQWRWQRKNLPFVKVGGALRIAEEDLVKFIEESKTNSNKNGRV